MRLVICMSFMTVSLIVMGMAATRAGYHTNKERFWAHAGSMALGAFLGFFLLATDLV